MSLFPTERDAKEFLAEALVREAARQGCPLTDIERKMLYFSETGWTPDDMTEVAETFDREYDQAEYERKIAKLAKAARIRMGKDRSAWSEAVRRLAEGDHYLLVMVGQAGNKRKPGALTWRGVVAVLSLLVALLAFTEWSWRYFGHSSEARARGALWFFIWAAGVAVVAAYYAVRLVVGTKTVDGWLDRVIERVVRAQRR